MRFTVKLLSVTLLLSACGFAAAQSMEITKNGTQKAITGAEKIFTGTSIVNPYFSSQENGISAASVTFAPASRSNWHGAAESTTLTHIAVQMFEDGKNVEWMEKVTDEQYSK